MGQTKSKSGDWRRLSESDCLALLTDNAGHSHLGMGSSIMAPSSSNAPVSSSTRDDLYLHRYRQKSPIYRATKIPNSAHLQGQYVREQFPSLEQRPRSAMETEMPLIQFDESDEDDNAQVQPMIHCPPSQQTLKAPAIYAKVRKVPAQNSAVQLRRQVPMPTSPTNRMYARRSMYPTSATGNSSGLFHVETPGLLPPPPSVMAIKNPELARAPGSGSGRRMRPISMFPVGREVGMLMSPNTLNGRMSYAEMLEECNTIEHCACDVEGCLEDDVVQIGSPQNNETQVNSASTEVGAIVDDNDDLMLNHGDGILSKQIAIVSHHHNDQQQQQQVQQSQSNQNCIESNQKEFGGFEIDNDVNNNNNNKNNNSIEQQSPDAQDDFTNNDAMNNNPHNQADSQQNMEFDRRNNVHSEGNARILRCSGLECLCDRCVSHRFKLLNWLLPNCTRINAERLLQGRPNGTFLVRKSEKFPGQYTLSFVCRRTVRHCLIMRSVYGFGLRWPYSFETLQQVIIHYVRNSLVEFNSKLDTRLRYPVFMT